MVTAIGVHSIIIIYFTYFEVFYYVQISTLIEEYFTYSILKILLADLIEKTMIGQSPKLFLRRLSSFYNLKFSNKLI